MQFRIGKKRMQVILTDIADARKQLVQPPLPHISNAGQIEHACDLLDLNSTH